MVGNEKKKLSDESFEYSESYFTRTTITTPPRHAHDNKERISSNNRNWFTNYARRDANNHPRNSRKLNWNLPIIHCAITEKWNSSWHSSARSAVAPSHRRSERRWRFALAGNARRAACSMEKWKNRYKTFATSVNDMPALSYHPTIHFLFIALTFVAPHRHKLVVDVGVLYFLGRHIFVDDFVLNRLCAGGANIFPCCSFHIYKYTITYRLFFSCRACVFLLKIGMPTLPIRSECLSNFIHFWVLLMKMEKLIFCISHRSMSLWHLLLLCGCQRHFLSAVVVKLNLERLEIIFYNFFAGSLCC